MVWVWNIHYLGIDDSFIYIKHSCVIRFLSIEVKCQGLSVNIKINFLNTCFFISLGHLFGKVRQMHKKVQGAILFKWKCGLLFQRNWENYWNDLHFCPPASQTESSMMHINSFKAVYCILQLNGSNHFPDNGQLERPLAKWLWSLSRLL